MSGFGRESPRYAIEEMTDLRVYDNAAGGDTIQAHNLIFAGDLYLDLDKPVTISGGYDCDYAALDGASKVNGDILISNGTVQFENVSVK